MDKWPNVPPLESWGRYELLTIEYAAAYLRVSKPTVRCLVKDEQLAAVPIGRKLFFTSLQLMAFIEREDTDNGPRI